ncbi:MAG: hypothetical protein ACM3UZ_04135 [Acidobacteriota bacterium]
MYKRKDNILSIMFFGYLLLTPLLVKWLGGSYFPLTMGLFIIGVSYAAWRPKVRKYL